MFGYRAAEMMGHDLAVIIPDKLRDRHNEGYRRVMAAGVSRYATELLAVPGLKKMGPASPWSSPSPWFKTTRATLGAAALIRDVTARWQRDQELKKRLAELEGRRPAPHIS